MDLSTLTLIVDAAWQDAWATIYGFLVFGLFAAAVVAVAIILKEFVWD